MCTKILKSFGFVCVSLLFLAGNAMADLIIAEGKPTGQWFNPDRDGEGFYVEVIDSGETAQLGIAMYSYDAEGRQLWIVGNAPVGAGATAVTVPVVQIDGPVWGSGYDPDDRNTTDFGTITARFTSCNSALFQVRPNVELQDLEYPAVRLTNVVGIECVDESPAPAGITAGEWEGEDGSACLYVAEDGKSLTTVGSTCVNGLSMWLDIVGIKVTLDGEIDPAGCKVDASCKTDSTIDPETGFFQCVTELGLIEGWFNSATYGWGHATQTIGGGLGNACVTEWEAAPKP
jgi:hypothetical protein